MTLTQRAPSALCRLLSPEATLSYPCLDSIRHRSYRTRAWARLEVTERGIFRCALWIAKARGKITNMGLVAQVTRIALKLLETVRSRIVKAGLMKADAMLREYVKPDGVFSWAPQIREWLDDPRYVWYLGVLEVNG